MDMYTGKELQQMEAETRAEAREAHCKTLSGINDKVKMAVIRNRKTIISDSVSTMLKNSGKVYHLERL